MTASAIITLVVGALVTFVFGTLGGAIVQWLFKADERKREAAREQAVKEKDAEEAEKRRIERINLLAEAQTRAQQTALESAEAAFQSAKAQCEECNHRLALSEERQSKTEERMYAAEERERKIQHVLRKLVRALDDDDETTKDEAIAAAKGML